MLLPQMNRKIEVILFTLEENHFCTPGIFIPFVFLL